MEPGSTSEPDSPTLLEARDGRPTALRLRRFAVRVQEGVDRGARAVFEGRGVRIGSDAANDLRLYDDFVSRLHAEVSVTPDGFLLSDLGSRNGTFLGANRVLKAYLEDGDRIRVGRTTLAFEVQDGSVRVPLAHDARFGGLIGETVAMRRLFEVLGRVAATEATVLLEGETGTGKEAAARAIHEASDRRSGPFVVVDCGAIPATLISAELFGHERGAFTGAVQGRAGAFERARGGTLLLDEVGELALELQPQLLRVLERKEVQRIGGSAYVPVDVRILAATHRDLRADVNAGRFRADLYFRLAVVEVRIPPLREHVEDLPLIVSHLLDQLSSRGSPGLGTPSNEEIAGLMKHHWPGNVRELRNVLERNLLLGAGLRVEGAPVRVPVSPPVPTGAVAGTELAQAPLRPFREAKAAAVDEFERAYLEALLAGSSGNVARAARDARMNRAYLIRLIKKHRLGK